MQFVRGYFITNVAFILLSYDCEGETQVGSIVNLCRFILIFLEPTNYSMFYVQKVMYNIEICLKSFYV